jgi:hypothetical protein
MAIEQGLKRELLIRKAEGKPLKILAKGRTY